MCVHVHAHVCVCVCVCVQDPARFLSNKTIKSIFKSGRVTWMSSIQPPCFPLARRPVREVTWTAVTFALTPVPAGVTGESWGRQGHSAELNLPVTLRPTTELLCRHAGTHTHTHTHTPTDRQTHTHTYTRPLGHTHTHMHACTNIHIHTGCVITWSTLLHTDNQRDTHTHIHTHTHTHRRV